jgi:hypothetical protein
MTLPVDDKLAQELPGEHLEKKRRRRNERNAAMYDDEVFELLQAIDLWRRKSHRSFPAWSEVIGIMKGLGWRKVAEPDAVPAAPEAQSAVVPVDPVEPVAPTPQ